MFAHKWKLMRTTCLNSGFVGDIKVLLCKSAVNTPTLLYSYLYEDLQYMTQLLTQAPTIPLKPLTLNPYPKSNLNPILNLTLKPKS